MLHIQVEFMSVQKTYNKAFQLTKIHVTNFGTQNIAPCIFATELCVKWLFRYGDNLD